MASHPGCRPKQVTLLLKNCTVLPTYKVSMQCCLTWDNVCQNINRGASTCRIFSMVCHRKINRTAVNQDLICKAEVLLADTNYGCSASHMCYMHVTHNTPLSHLHKPVAFADHLKVVSHSEGFDDLSLHSWRSWAE